VPRFQKSRAIPLWKVDDVFQINLYKSNDKTIFLINNIKCGDVHLPQMRDSGWACGHRGVLTIFGQILTNR